MFADTNTNGFGVFEFSPQILAVDLPHVSILDSDLGTPRKVGGIAGFDADFLQSQVLCFSPMIWVESGFLLAGNVTEKISARRKSKILIKGLFTDAGATATIRIIYDSLNGYKAMSAVKAVGNSEIADGNYYMAELLDFDSLGCRNFSIKVISITAGQIAIGLAAI